MKESLLGEWKESVGVLASGCWNQYTTVEQSDCNGNIQKAVLTKF